MYPKIRSVKKKTYPLYLGNKDVFTHKVEKFTWLVTGLCFAILQILSICEILKLDTPMDLVKPMSTSSSMAYGIKE